MRNLTENEFFAIFDVLEEIDKGLIEDLRNDLDDNNRLKYLNELDLLFDMKLRFKREYAEQHEIEYE